MSQHLYVDCTTGETKSQEEITLKDGKRNWQGKKKISLDISKIMYGYDRERAERINNCGSLLKFKQNDKLKLTYANFCRERMCPLCTWRRALRLSVQSDKIYKILSEKYKHIFVTVTVKNCKAEDLKETIDMLYMSARKMQNSKRFKSSFIGFYRAFEITYDSNEYITSRGYDRKKKYYDSLGLRAGDKNPTYDTYHPHFHYLMTVDNNYFDKESNSYMTQNNLCDMWKEFALLDYNPLCSIEKIVQKENQSMTSACIEMCKYPAKAMDVLSVREDKQEEVLRTIDFNLRDKRLVSYGGVTATTRKELKLKDVEGGDLIHVDDDKMNVDDNIPEIVYAWRSGVYIPVNYKKMTTL